MSGLLSAIWEMNGCGRQVGALRSCDVAMDANVTPGRKLYVRVESPFPLGGLLSSALL